MHPLCSLVKVAVQTINVVRAMNSVCLVVYVVTRYLPFSSSFSFFLMISYSSSYFSFTFLNLSSQLIIITLATLADTACR